MEVNLNGRWYGYESSSVSKLNPAEDTAVQEEQETPQTGNEQTEKPNQDVYEPSGKGKRAMDVETVKRMKAELEQTQNRFMTLVREMLGKQNKAAAEADTDLWKILSGGDFEVDLETKTQAQAAIAADGYWGVEQTSQRLVGFARALVGSDPEQVESMRAAFVQGFEAAKEVWGGNLPEISQKTYEATMKLFDEWAASAEKEQEEVPAPVE